MLLWEIATKHESIFAIEPPSPKLPIFPIMYSPLENYSKLQILK